MGLYSKILFLGVLVPDLCAGQSTTTALCSTCTPAPTCTGCNINADVVTTSNTSWQYLNPATGTPFLMANLYFTAYSVTTAFLLSGKCVTHTQSPISLVDAYIVTVPEDPMELLPTSVLYSSMDAVQQSSFETDGYSSFLNDAYSSFYAAKGWEGCTASIPPSQPIPTFMGLKASVSPTVSPSITLVGSSATATSAGNITASSTRQNGAYHTRIIILSVIIPVVGLIILLFCLVVIYKYRVKKRNKTAAVDRSETASTTQLYVDQKVELEDEERRRHVWKAARMMHEMDAEDTMAEMPGDGDSRMELGVSEKRYELKGAEHAQELSVPDNPS